MKKTILIFFCLFFLKRVECNNDNKITIYSLYKYLNALLTRTEKFNQPKDLLLKLFDENLSNLEKLNSSAQPENELLIQAQINLWVLESAIETEEIKNH